MSNLLTSDPIYLDTAGTITLARTVNMFKSVEWSVPTKAGDQATLTDADGNVVCEFLCPTNPVNQIKYFAENSTPFNSPFTLVLDSGHLLISRL